MKALCAIVVALAFVLGACASRVDAGRPIVTNDDCQQPDNGDGVLRRGEHGQAVVALQTRLNWWADKQARARLEVDGCFDWETAEHVQRFQADKGLPVTGKYGPQTRAVMEGGASVPKRPERPAEGHTAPSASTSAPQSRSHSSETRCRPGNRRARFVICVDTSSQYASVREARDGKIGRKLFGSRVTTSRKITRPHDTITRRGRWTVSYWRVRTPLLGLRNFLGFAGGQGVHCYHQVGPRFDSGGCVRTPSAFCARYWHLFTSTGALGRGEVAVHVW